MPAWARAARIRPGDLQKEAEQWRTSCRMGGPDLRACLRLRGWGLIREQQSDTVPATSGMAAGATWEMAATRLTPTSRIVPTQHRTPMDSLVILHLTDVHFGQPAMAGRWPV